MEKKRTSNIELLKVIAMIIIVLAHNTPVANNVKLRGELEFLIDGNLATANWQELIVDIGIYFSQFAVCIFFVCSVWFLVDSKAVKPRKILYMWVDLFFFSVVYAVVIKIIYPEMTWETFIKSFFPFSTNETWYISCYVLLYAIHPLLNVVIYGIAKRTLLLSVMITSVLYGVIMFFVPGGGGFYYNQLVGFIVIYFIIAYLKIYLPTFMENKRINLILCICSFVLLICEIAGTDYLCLKINRLSHQLGHWRTFSNPPIVLCSITLLNLFRTLRFNSRTVNYISSCSMLIYIIHENWLFREYLRTDYFRWIYYAFTYDKLLLWCFLLALVSFAASLTVAAIYKKTIQGRIYWLSDRIYAVLSRCGNAILNFVLKLN